MMYKTYAALTIATGGRECPYGNVFAAVAQILGVRGPSFEESLRHYHIRWLI